MTVQWYHKHQLVDRMTMSNIVAIIILLHMSHHRDFNNVYRGYLGRFYPSACPTLLSYTRFIEVILSRLDPLCGYFSSLKTEPTGIEFMGSTSIKVCHNLRIARHKTLSRLACRANGAMANSGRNTRYADKGYISKPLSSGLLKNGVTLVPQKHARQ